MRKKFIAPKMSTLKVQDTILAGSTNTLTMSNKEVTNETMVGARVSRFRTWALGKMDF